MKRLRASASGSVSASPEECFDFLVAIERYPDWYPEVVRAVELIEGRFRIDAVLHISMGPVGRDLELTLALSAPNPEQIRLTRLPNEPGDPEEFELVWHLAPARLTLTIEANLDVPALLPIGKAGDELARGFLEAAVANLREPRA